MPIKREEDQFYLYAMELFSRTGHVVTSKPNYANHSPNRFVYLDSKSDFSISKNQQRLLNLFDNVSELFSVNDCVFFSISLLCTRSDRSRVARDIHTMAHSLTNAEGTICLFRFEEEVILSFSGFGYQCFLSDWYLMNDDFGLLSERLDIVNMSIKSNRDYFRDLVYALARQYYLQNTPTRYELFPIDFFNDTKMSDYYKEAIDELFQYEFTRSQREYGDDYVEYGKVAVVNHIANYDFDIDMMLLEMDNEDSNADAFDTEMDSVGFGNEDDSLNIEPDQYEYENLDPELFRDPIKMVKWINRINH